MGRRENRAMEGFFRAARHLAIIALLVRGMLPAGWMPDAQGGLTLCSVATLGVIHHDGQGPADGKVQHEECAFAAAAHLAATPDAPQLILPAFHSFAAETDGHYAAEVSAHFTPQSPRAPPRIV
jgi:hypothetical protein